MPNQILGRLSQSPFAFRRSTVGGGVPVPSPITAMIYGQSEMEYLLNNDLTYRELTQPTPGDGNLIVFTQKTVTDQAPTPAPVRTVVNAASVAAGQVNPDDGRARYGK